MFLGYKIVALCISRVNDERNFEFTKALNDALTAKGFRLFVYHTCSDLYWKTEHEKGEKSVFSLIDYSITDAVIIFDEAFCEKDILDEIVGRAGENGVPVISVGAERDGCISFLFDYTSGFEQIVRHVVEYHKPETLHFIAGRKGEIFSEQRIEVYKKVLSENGIAFSENDISYGDYWYAPTTAAVQKLIEEKRVPKAIICANDMMAITACAVLSDNGINVPRDVIVTGFDGTNEARLAVPPITTCKCDLNAAAEKIVSAVCGILDGGKLDAVNYISYKPDIYASCGCPDSHGVCNMGLLLRTAEDRFNRYQADERLLYEMAESIFSCGSVEKMIENFSGFNFYDLCAVVNNQVLDPKINPALDVYSNGFSESMTLLYQSQSDKGLFPAPFKRSNTIGRAEYFITRENPIIFTALVFMGIPFGYAAFYFGCNYESCCKIPQYVTALNNSIGGYRNIRYAKYIAIHDYMTGLYNRSGFYSEAERLIKENPDKRIMIASADVDGLKYINDNFGHDGGDYVICEAANALCGFRLKSKVCGRFGGDELALCAVLEDNEDGEAMLREDMESYVKKINSLPNKKFELSVSVGVCISDGGLTIDGMLKKADELMYKEKSGKPHRERK